MHNFSNATMDNMMDNTIHTDLGGTYNTKSMQITKLSEEIAERIASLLKMQFTQIYSVESTQENSNCNDSPDCEIASHLQKNHTQKR